MPEEMVVMQPAQPTLMGLIDRLLTNDQNANMETVEKMLAMQERWEQREAMKAFNVAFAAFQAESVTIVKNVTVTDGPLKNKKYADKFGVVNAITGAMSKHGLSRSWKLTKDEPQWMEVTCTLKHVLGHSETASMGSAPDAGPGRNAIQARSSANSYLERITLLAITGLAAADEDNDGEGGSISVDDIEQDILSAPTEKALVEIFNRSYKAAAKDPAAQKRYRAARDVRRGELCAS